MPSLDSFDFLVLGLFRAPLHEVRSAAQTIIEETFPPGSFEISEAPLDIDCIYTSSPPPGGAHEKRAVLFEPGTSRGSTALIANIEDGWLTTCNVLAKRIPGEHVLVRSCTQPAYPLADMEVWKDGASVRYVGALREEPSWSFESRGEPRSFEEPANYKKRKITERLNREILVGYLAKIGWQLADREFWNSSLPACSLREHR